MKTRNRKTLWLAVGFLALFVLWTAVVRLADVRAIGPLDSSVGMATLNGFVHELTGVHMALYTLTDWLGLLPFGIAAGFGGLGLWQWIKRGKLSLVDRSLWVLGGFYLAVMGVYVLFELVPINYRPVLIEGRLEVSYPSSTTMLVMCVIPTAALQLRERIRKAWLRRGVIALLTGFMMFMVVGRLISGVHWFTDILGGAWVSAGLVLLYAAVCQRENS